jgi:c(7)-type cytochrome triheme protein
LRHILQAAVILCAGLLAACSSQNHLFKMLFDVPPPGKNPANAPVVHLPRRVPPKPVARVTATKEYLAEVAALKKLGPPTDWPAMFKKLPKDDDNNIDWIGALADKIIKPRAWIDPDAPDTHKVINLDVPLSTSGKPERVVEFSHQNHGKWLACSNCHPAIFVKDAGADKITMDDIDAGKYCGVCHDKVAIALGGCNGCHKGIQKMPETLAKEYRDRLEEQVKAAPPPDRSAFLKKLPKDRKGNINWIDAAKGYLAMQAEPAKAGPSPDWLVMFKKLPKDDDGNIDWIAALANDAIKPVAEIDPKKPNINRVIDLDVPLSTSGKPERVVEFSHKNHGKWLACSNCHPAIFAKEAGADKITMDDIDAGKYCGACHDKVAIAPGGCKGCHKGIKEKL